MELGKTLAADVRVKLKEGRQVKKAWQQRPSQQDAHGQEDHSGKESGTVPSVSEETEKDPEGAQGDVNVDVGVAADWSSVLSGLNPSTASLMQRYLSRAGDGAYDPDMWRTAPPAFLGGGAAAAGDKQTQQQRRRGPLRAVGRVGSAVVRPLRKRAAAVNQAVSKVARRNANAKNSPTPTYFDGFADEFPE